MKVMSRQSFFYHLSLVLLLVMFSHKSSAEALRCEKVVISGELGWPPYSYMNSDGQLTGAGIELGRLLFHELNIPVEVRPMQSQRDLEHALRRGHVDVLVSTYDLPKYEDLVRLVFPNYYEDTIAIVVPQGKWFEFSDWHDLMGRTGITTSNEQLGREFNEYAEKNLNIHSVGNLRYVFRKLARGEYDYIIGSAQLLKTGVNWYGQEKAEFLPMLVSAEDVYMAFSEASACKGYAAFVRARLKELNENQVVYTLVQKHTEQAQN